MKQNVRFQLDIFLAKFQPIIIQKVKQSAIMNFNMCNTVSGEPCQLDRPLLSRKCAV